ncbi:MAG: glutamate--tRNA ligase family protein [Proteobacteria bacterium]|nr:glutamate--tRNA ligase family protein [Pseudomonadota bacterium]
MLHALRHELQSLPSGLCTRFAPSPTGYLHLGHAASAIYVWGIAQAIDAKVILRLEDHDRQRSRLEYSKAILEDLTWLGFIAEAPTDDAKDPMVYQQSDHPLRYQTAREQLEAQLVLYHCQCSRKMIQERTQASPRDELFYDNYCRSSQWPATDAGLRIRFDEKSFTFRDLWLGEQKQIPSSQCGDLLLRDREGQWTYNFAVTVDDIADQIGLIIRGQDLIEACGRQLQLRQMLGVTSPLHFLHHPLIWASSNQKLSKRYGSPALRALRQEGLRPGLVLGQAAHATGLIDSVRELSPHELGDLFR